MSENSTINIDSSLTKENLSCLYATGYELYRGGKYHDARNFFRLITYANPHDRRSWMGLGACYQMSKLYKEAIECYSVAAMQKSEDPYVHFHAAECYQSLGDQKLSLEILDSALKLASSQESSKPLKERIENLKVLWEKGASNA